MGNPSTRSFDFTGYATASAAYKAAPTAAAAFVARKIDPYLDPKKITIRESRDSAANPNSTPIILGLDVTGSMGFIAHEIAMEGLGTIIKEINARSPVSDPHLMFMCIGDAHCDEAPLQVSQFETGMELMEQLGKIYVEGHGGGNDSESYNLPWHFAAYHTSCDSFEKRGRKGYLFTMGDERVPPNLTEAQLQKVYGRDQEPLATNDQLLEALAAKYHVFHLIIEQGNAMRHDSTAVKASWAKQLGQRAIPVADYTKIPEIIISTMQIVEGANKDAVVKSWSGDTSLAVASAVKDLIVPGATSGGLVRL